MNIKEYANYLIPNVKHEYDYYLDLYKKRNLKEGAYVLRSAPSPTGKWSTRLALSLPMPRAL